MPIAIISLIIQIALVVHIVKTGRNMTWVFIVIFVPLVGSIAYFIVELLPELSGTRTARSLKRNISEAVDPNKDFKSASQRLALADTVQNSMTLAAECLARGKYADAQDLYSRCLKGVHSDDPDIHLGLARAQFGLGEFGEAVKTLDALKAKNPDYKSADGHLLYARCQEQLGNTEAAIHEYEALVSYYSGPEPSCRLALIFKSQGKTSDANRLCERVLSESKFAGKHYNTIHKEWVSLAHRELSG